VQLITGKSKHGAVQRKFLFALIASVSFFLAVFASLNLPAKAAIYAGPQSGWLVISSHSYERDAIKQAQKYAQNFPTTVVFRSTNGFFAVSLGWVNKQAGKRVVRNLSSGGYIPADSYIHNGQRWIEAVWSANNIHLQSQRGFIASSRLSAPGSPQPHQPELPRAPPPPQIIAMAPTSALVDGLQSTVDNFLSLRSGPSTTYGEIVRMRTGTRLTITGKSRSWYQVKLNDGTSGFAYSKYVRLAPVRTVGPDTSPTPDIPIVGPTPDNNDEPQVAKLPDVEEKEDTTPLATSPTPGNDVAISDQKRVALVFGNSAYLNTANLANPKNDADAMATKLENLGFSVIKGLDLDKVGMELAIREFVKEMANADVTLFFYAGHAMQVDGINYLIPVDAALEDATALDFETINFNTVINFMNAGDRTSIALLDACRNNPLARTFKRQLSKSRAILVQKGLAAPTSEGGELLIGFATSPGEVALDGEGTNSPFTAALLKHIETPDLEIELMLKRVKADVYAETDGTQSPWNNSALRKEFYFAQNQ